MRRSLYCLCLFLLASFSTAREVAKYPLHTSSAAGPAYCTALHDVGRMGLLVTNGGTLGVGNWPPPSTPFPDTFLSPYTGDWSECHLGKVLPYIDWYGAEYPLGSNNRCLQVGGLWIGALTETGDTLVSTSYIGNEPLANLEMYASPAPTGNILTRSLLDPATKDKARSEQDYIAVFTDTSTASRLYLEHDAISRRTHRPLGVEITQSSSQWSNPLVDDFVLIEYSISNIGYERLNSAFVGIYLYLAHGRIGASLPGYADIGSNQTGMLRNHTSPGVCACMDTLDMVWSSNVGGGSDNSSAAIRVLKAPSGAHDLTYNWWVNNWQWDAKYDYGPRHRPPAGESPRSFGHGGTGTPLGDANKYYMMANGEIDPDVARVQQILPTDPTWEYPSEYARAEISPYGYVINVLLSVGPFDLSRGEEQSFVVAYFGGENFHKYPDNGRRLVEGDVDGWYANVNFSDLIKNAKQAEWVYDNPGYDTDGDGYRGKFHVCVLDSLLVDSAWVPTIAETTYYAGDGIPDWRAVGPPPAPKFWLYPYDHSIRVRMNGQNSETARDLVSGKVDFEGYRIYLGRDDREASLALAAGCDLKNYDKFVWNPKIYPSGGFEVQEVPLTIDQLRCLYGLGSDPCHDSIFDPLAYTAGAPYRLPGFLGDSIFYFVQHGYNASRLGVDTPIRKLYPNSPKPIPGETIPDSAYTEDGYLKYYEYECIIDGLLPTVPYYVNVTAFDFGDPAGGVEALESSKLLGLQDCYALENANQTGATNKPVYIYPNPYRTDAKYREMGYEGRGSDRINDRERRIHFANLPAKCWIRIHTLDGDMVREIRHDMDPNDPASDHDTWDLINRNVMAVESGLYYWSVEPDSGPVQIGKLVIIR